VATASIELGGVQYTCTTFLVRNERGPVVGVAVSADGAPRGQAGFLPPYHLSESESLANLPMDRLQEEILRLFMADSLPIRLSFLLSRYQALIDVGIDSDTLAVKMRATFYSSPNE
jgi:hypothetical protein